ncbi:MAG: rhamnulose-1-phosphate aldolase [Clostridia bacterium]|nr:rhamnulose-1-phosphate aldolase [Clostridia bacterium]
MEIIDSKFVKQFIKLADDGNKMGWHERNGGNLSYRIPVEEIKPYSDKLDRTREWNDIGTDVPKLGGAFFIVTGSGKYMSNMLSDPESNCAVIEISPDGTKYRIVWGLKSGGRPTSELPTHLMNHEVKMEATGGEHRVIYHCHPANIIAMTFILPIDDKVFSHELWEMMTECPIIFPAGVGTVRWMVPGGREIAVETSEKMKKYDAVVWAHHGLFCSAPDFDLAFGLAHTIEKAAEIFIKVRSVTNVKAQTITDNDFVELAKAFKIDLNKDFLG